MPLRTDTFDLDEEVERLREERDAVAEELAALPEDAPGTGDLGRRGQRLDDMLAGVLWARDEAHADDAVAVWDEPAETITLGGLTGGEYGAIEDDVRTSATDQGLSSAEGTARTFMVARGTVDAPYHDPDADEDAQLAAAAQLPYQYLTWAEAHINEMTTVGNGGEKSFGALVRAKRQDTSTETSE